MIDVLLLYVFLVVFIIVLFYMILLYSDYDTSIIYRDNTSTGGTITPNSTPSLLTAADGSNIEFTPNINFRKKKIYGKIKLVFSSDTQASIDLSIRDAGNSNEIVGDKTTFTIYDSTKYGTTTACMVFETSSLTSNVHNIQVYASTNSSATLKLHDAVIYYY